MASWIVELALVLMWAIYLGFGSSQGMAYFLFGAACMALMNTAVGVWLVGVCGGYAGSDAATIVFLVLATVWVLHLAFGASPTWNYVLFFAVVIALGLTQLGLSLLAAFHH